MFKRLLKQIEGFISSLFQFTNLALDIQMTLDHMKTYGKITIHSRSNVVILFNNIYRYKTIIGDYLKSRR
jgi:hypothetical protein